MKKSKKMYIIGLVVFIVLGLFFTANLCNDQKRRFNMIYEKFVSAEVEIIPKNEVDLKNSYYVEGDTIAFEIKYNKKLVKDKINGDFDKSFISIDGFDADINVEKRNQYYYLVYIENIRKNDRYSDYIRAISDDEKGKVECGVCPISFKMPNIGLDHDIQGMNINLMDLSLNTSAPSKKDVMAGGNLYYDLVYQGDIYKITLNKNDVRLSGFDADIELYNIKDNVVRVSLTNIKFKEHSRDTNLADNECKIYISGGTAITPEFNMVNAATAESFYLYNASDAFYKKVNNNIYLVIIIFLAPLIELIINIKNEISSIHKKYADRKKNKLPK